ncbi:hypothetical protein ACFY6U_00290 [Streptomyces sp. NPDC013157]|uniref:hypothetical protein n=1 Tax=unclassified Streptomyces TaxID=2593676 RepID=UPI0036A0AD00
MESSQAVRTGGRIGWTLPAHNTEPRAQLAEVRERGYAAMNTPGDASEIAALVRDKRGRPRAAPITTSPTRSYAWPRS